MFGCPLLLFLTSEQYSLSFKYSPQSNIPPQEKMKDYFNKYANIKIKTNKNNKLKNKSDIKAMN